MPENTNEIRDILKTLESDARKLMDHIEDAQMRLDKLCQCADKVPNRLHPEMQSIAWSPLYGFGSPL